MARLNSSQMLTESDLRKQNIHLLWMRTVFQILLARLLRELSLHSYFWPDVSFLWPVSVSLSGILTSFWANYWWKCSLDIKFCSLEKGSNTLSSRRRNALSCKPSMQRRNRISNYIISSRFLWGEISRVIVEHWNFFDSYHWFTLITWCDNVHPQRDTV